MNVQEIKIDKLTRYIVVDEQGIPVIPIIKYIKFLDKKGISPNTQKTYSFALKLYFEYLSQVNIDYKDININTLSEFISWLRNPNASLKVTNITPIASTRSERTINLIITVVTNFYDYLFRVDELQNNMTDKIFKKMYIGKHRKFKDFLFHVNKNRPINKNILKLKEHNKKLETLTKDQVETLYSACKNLRDKLLIRVLFETGFRISEALSLHIDDFIFDLKNGHKIRIVDRGEIENNAFLKTGEREVYVSQELMNLFDDYEYEVLDELDLDCNFVFIVLNGKNTGKPLTYRSARGIFEALSKRTKIPVHAHMLRHTHATLYYEKTKDVKQVQERLGHKQISTTMDLYVHPSEKEIRNSWNKAKSNFNLQEDNK